MEDTKMLNDVKNVVENVPSDWLRLTTHRLDIYNESLAKTEFLDHFEKLLDAPVSNTSALNNLPTAFDYIRLGHPLSCVLEWTIAKMHGIKADQVISFASRTAPIMAVLRKNLLENQSTQINFSGTLPDCFDADVLRKVYGYNFELKEVGSAGEITAFDGSNVYVSYQEDVSQIDKNPAVDFYVNLHDEHGSIIVANGDKNLSYIPEIQHVRRRETIAMTPASCYVVLRELIGLPPVEEKLSELEADKTEVRKVIKEVTGASTKPLVGSSGLSVQYAIMMGLIDDAIEKHPGKAIKIIVPPNCYGGTNDQARRVAACLDNVEILDLPVDGGQNMVQSIDVVLNAVAKEDAIPYIIAEIPTNPRVEVPDLEKLKEVLSMERTTSDGRPTIDPVFILDQTFCPNVLFLGEGEILSSIRTISYVSGSKFPSGGRCTAGYCVASEKAAELMDKIEIHMNLCDNEATPVQYQLLAEQLSSMNTRIVEAYKNTREFVNFIRETLPTAKINFVSEELAERGFMPSVFSLDLPTKGETEEERETYKRQLNNILIDMMIHEIPDESKFCVSYGQLKGCYWTIPATSTQGTTKEGDKDYIVRVALSPNMDLERHKQVFKKFVADIK